MPRFEPLVALAPHLNAAVVAVATVTVVAGVRAIRRGDVTRHRRLMLTSFALFLLFLVVYLYRVTLEGPASFSGPTAVYRRSRPSASGCTEISDFRDDETPTVSRTT